MPSCLTAVAYSNAASAKRQLSHVTTMKPGLSSRLPGVSARFFKPLSRLLWPFGCLSSQTYLPAFPRWFL